MKTLSICLISMCILGCAETVLSQNLPNEAVARRYLEEVVNGKKLDLLDEIFKDTFLVHTLIDNRQEEKTIAVHRKFLEYLFGAFPDIHYTVGEIISEGDKVAMRASLKGTHKNEFFGHDATGNHIDHLSEIFFFRFTDGKIAESWVQIDMYNLLNHIKGAK